MLWCYAAVGPEGEIRRGELSAESAADARALLRGIGLQVLDVRLARAAQAWKPMGFVARRRRRCRTALKADLFDGLATLLEAGLPWAEAVTALGGSADGSAARSMLGCLREDVRGGASPAQAMRRRPDWFDEVEVAMVEAGERADLPSVIRALAERLDRVEELSSRLIGALAYPVLVLIVGFGVVAYLSTVTLPRFSSILAQSGVETPTVTLAVMAFGRSLATWWLVGVASVIPMAAVGRCALKIAESRASGRWIVRLTPRLVRQILLSRVCRAISELTRAGVPLAEALRIAAPTARGMVGSILRRRLESAASRLDRGEPLSAVFDDELWFDASLRLSIVTGQDSGEIPVLLERLGHKYERTARRAIDRVAALAEPVMIVALAALVGLVVMAAVLPMLRLQEVIR